jgi:formate hydrogenlyase subunit 3/multisubunit Na+/H+ antiporter MnhD subunit
MNDVAHGRWLVARATGQLNLDDAIQFLRTARSKGDARHAALLFDVGLIRFSGRVD